MKNLIEETMIYVLSLNTTNLNKDRGKRLISVAPTHETRRHDDDVAGILIPGCHVAVGAIN